MQKWSNVSDRDRVYRRLAREGQGGGDILSEGQKEVRGRDRQTCVGAVC